MITALIRYKKALLHLVPNKKKNIEQEPRSPTNQHLMFYSNIRYLVIYSKSAGLRESHSKQLWFYFKEYFLILNEKRVILIFFYKK